MIVMVFRREVVANSSRQARSAPRRNVLVVLSRMLNRMLPSFASDDPAFVNGFDARGHFIKGTDVNFDLTLIATEDARTTNRTEASSPKGRYQTRVFELPGVPIRVSQKCRARHLAAIGAMTEAAFIWLALHGVADGTAQAPACSNDLRGHDRFRETGPTYWSPSR